jgi:hypothetical protein
MGVLDRIPSEKGAYRKQPPCPRGIRFGGVLRFLLVLAPRNQIPHEIDRPSPQPVGTGIEYGGWLADHGIETCVNEPNRETKPQ